MDNQKQQPDDADSNKKESTNSGGNDDTPSTSSSKPKDIIHDDVCSICFDDVSILDNKTYVIYTCCGKAMHRKCHVQLRGTKSLSLETRNSCPMCRTLNVASGSEEHVERLQKWSMRNRSWAQFGLGSLYDRGLGVKRDMERACKFYRLAADQGHHRAQYNLGVAYATGNGVVQSDTLAFKYFKLSADQGYADAQNNVGSFYATGKGVDQSDTNACTFWRLAVNQGFHLAQYNLGSMHEEGRGVIQSDALAFKYYKLAAEQGHSISQFNVGNMYYNGEGGVTQSFTKAREWLTKSAKQGQERAIEILIQLDKYEGRTTSSSFNFTDNSTVCQFEGCESTTKKNGKELMRCPCQTASYCCKKHQKLAYPGHKKECKRLRKEMSKQKPNDRCACGSNKKYKKCCGSKKR
jgi:TPR repeat protein